MAAIEEDDGEPVVHERGSGGGSVPAMALSTSISRPKRNTMLTEKARYNSSPYSLSCGTDIVPYPAAILIEDEGQAEFPMTS